MNNNSYTAASTLPAKIFTNEQLINNIKRHNIKPIHIQINPTNKCPYNCSFCSCKNRDRAKELEWGKLKKTLEKFISLGTKAVTITGGGDPLAYKNFRELIKFLTIDNNIDTSLTTNGFLLDKYYDFKELNNIIWSRISVYDEYDFLSEKIEKIVKLNKSINWSFSYVASKNFLESRLIECIDFANKHNFTHVRVVSDILNSDVDITNKINDIKSKVNTDKVIFQNRKEYQKGKRKCLISLMKPNIDAEGNIYPCCGVQYAIDDTIRDFDKRLLMGTVDDIDEIYNEQKYFDGSICNKCYYSDYNVSMNMLWDSDKLKHKNFI